MPSRETEAVTEEAAREALKTVSEYFANAEATAADHKRCVAAQRIINRYVRQREQEVASARRALREKGIKPVSVADLVRAEVESE